MRDDSGPDSSGLRWVSGCAPQLASGAAATASASPDLGVTVQDAGGAIVAANEEAARLLGLTWEQLVGRTSMDARWSAVGENGLPLTGDQHPAMVSLATGEDVSGFLMGVMTPIDVGEIGRSLSRARWIEIASHPVFEGTDAGGPVLGVVAVFADVTESERGRLASDVQWAAVQLVIQNADDVVVRTDDAGIVRWVSLSADRELGWRPGDLVGTAFADLVHPDDRYRLDDLRSEMRRLSGDEAAPRGQFRLALPKGEWRWVSAAGRLLLDRDLEVAGELYTMRDIESEIEAQQRLADSEERFRLIAENASDIVLHVRDDVIVWASPSIAVSMGGTVDDWVGRPITDLIHPDDRSTADDAAARLDSEDSVLSRFRAADHSGRMHWLEANTRRYLDRNGRPDGYISSIRVVDAVVAAEQALARQARFDSLTGLLNRAEALEVMAHVVGSERRGGSEVAVLFCDLDVFKEINDTYGHLAGDEVLRAVSDRISTRIRSGDVAARIGGDELLVVLAGVRDIGDATAIAEKIRAAVAVPVQATVGPVSTTVSIGVAVARRDESVDDLIARADRAMYLAKANGRDRVVVV